MVCHISRRALGTAGALCLLASIFLATAATAEKIHCFGECAHAHEMQVTYSCAPPLMGGRQRRICEGKQARGARGVSSRE